LKEIINQIENLLVQISVALHLEEMYVQVLAANNGENKKIIAVRFGNVLSRSGGMIPTFKNEISTGGPVKVTRYFMTIPEAVGLVLQNGALRQGGEIFVLDIWEIQSRSLT
jgi:FlaA1/EpsC-like NDP-sugar epimerase